MKFFLLEIISLFSLIVLFWLYLFFVSDYSLTLLAEKERKLDNLKYQFFTEQSENNYLTKNEKTALDQETVLSDYGYVKEEEILFDLQIPIQNENVEDKKDQADISLSTFLFVIGFFLMLLLNLLLFYKRKNSKTLKPIKK